VLVDPVWGFMLLTGFSVSALRGRRELNQAADNRNRGQLLSLYVITMLVGLAAGQLCLLNLSDPVPASELILISILISLLPSGSYSARHRCRRLRQ
jgi:hypothetical protein